MSCELLEHRMTLLSVDSFRIDHEKGITLANRSVEVSSVEISYIIVCKEFGEVNVPALHKVCCNSKALISVKYSLLYMTILSNDVMSQVTLNGSFDHMNIDGTR